MADTYDIEAARAAKREKARLDAAAKRRANGNGHDPGGWQDQLATNQHGRPLATLANAVIGLQHAPEVVAWNEFSGRVMRRGPVMAEVGDVDILHMTVWLQGVGINVGSRITSEAVRIVADSGRYHPVRDYLHRLTWDGVRRLDLWLSDHLGAKDTELNRAFAAKWLIGLVARVMQPGCQLDAALIFESRQGLGKSSTLRALAEPWFTDHLPDLTSKDAMQQIQGVWIVEIAELDSLQRAETHRIKSFISARVDRFRAPYGMLPADCPRQCGFAGTVNPGANGYLRDETGARRFWTVACGIDWPAGQKVDIAALAAVRDQLWAEAVTRYRAGEPWHLDTTELEDEQASAAEERQEDDPRDRAVAAFLDRKKTHADGVHMADILGSECLDIPFDRWNRALRTDVGKVVSALNWQRRLVRDGTNGRAWRYFPPSPVSPANGTTGDRER